MTPTDLPDVPLLEDDLAAPGVIDPAALARAGTVPDVVVLCFFTEVMEAIEARGDGRRVATLTAAHGRHPVWAIERDGRTVGVVHPGVGAPLAAFFLEDVIARGARTVVAVGGAGALVDGLSLGHAVVVDSAVRDEGTSFHYLPPGRVVAADPTGVAALQEVLAEQDVPHLTGRTWTTDAFYRETRQRVARRVAEGCLTVEMEASAFIAVCRFRGVRFAQLLYAGDTLAGEQWDERGWTSAEQVRERVFWLAVDAALRLSGAPRP